jgi:periplasmic protein TonB
MSDLGPSIGHLSECLIENDAEAIQRGRRLRRKALALSLVLEAAVLAALLAWPLLNPATLNAHYVSIPVPPYRRGAPERPRETPRPPAHHPVPVQVLLQPAIIPTHVDRRPEPAPAIDTTNSFGSADPKADILGVDGGNDLLSNVRPPQPPRPPERPVQTRRIVSDVMEAMLITRVQPDYPEAAKLLHISGTVKLRAIISTDGRVKELTVLNGNPILARAAIQAVSEWRYRPTLLSGQPVEVETLITVNFVLE